MNYKAVIFGGHSPIAKECARLLGEHQEVILVTRNVDSELTEELCCSANINLMEGDISKKDGAKEIIQKIYAADYEINIVLFMQRYRPRDKISFQEHCRVELWSISEAIEELVVHKKADSEVNILISSSPAAIKVVDDQDLQYHIVKSGQEALTRYCAVKYGRNGININAIRIGSIVFKDRARNYWNSVPEIVQGLESVTPIGSLPSSTEVAKIFSNIALAKLKYLSGQVLSYENGFELTDASQLAKSIFSM